MSMTANERRYRYYWKHREEIRKRNRKKYRETPIEERRLVFRKHYLRGVLRGYKRNPESQRNYHRKYNQRQDVKLRHLINELNAYHEAQLASSFLEAFMLW